MHRSRSNSLKHLAGLVTCLGSTLLFAAQEPVEGRSEHTACEKPLASILVIDDQVNTSAWMVDQLRRFQLANPAQVLRQALEPRDCFVILESDPIFWNFPGTAQPELILRATVSELAATEKNLGEKASTAVGRYIGSYLGTTDAEVPALHAAAVQIDVLCPKSRRSATRVSTRRTVPELKGERRADHNGIAVREAFDDAADGLIAAIQQGARYCEINLVEKVTP